MIQGIAALFTPQLSTYRHQVLTSPELLDEQGERGQIYFLEAQQLRCCSC